MKTLLLFGLGCALATSATAQTEKGARYIGANVGDLGYSRNDNNNSFSARLLPGAGVFVADNFLLGADLQLSYSTYRVDAPNYKSRIRGVGYGLAPFARYYLPGTSPHRFFGQVQAGVSRNSSRTRAEGTFFDSGGQLVSYSQDQRNRSNAINFGAALGYNYFLTPNAALQAIAGYNRLGYGDFNSSGALSVTAGFAVFLPSKGAAAPAN